MTAALTAIALLTGIGLPLALALKTGLQRSALAGLSFLLGAGLAALVLLGLSLVGVPWSPWSVGLGLLMLIAATLLGTRNWRLPEEAAQPSRKRLLDREGLAAGAVDLLTVVAVIGHGLFASLAPLAQWDFWTVWGLKARVFWTHRGIDWLFLEDVVNRFTHPDYPPLLPLTLDFFSLVGGEWEDRWIGLAFTAFALSLLLVARALLREELQSDLLAALATFALAGPALLIWIGLAEGPLIAYASLGLLLARRALRQGRCDAASWTLPALMLGFAALTKNEGVALLLAAAIAVALDPRGRWRRAFQLWPAAVLAAAWWLPRRMHSFSTDIFEGSLLERVSDRLASPASLFQALSHNPPEQSLLWLFLLLSLAFFWREAVSAERFLCLAVLVQVLFFLLLYLATPNELAWQVWTSWPRLLAQQAFSLTFLAVVLLLSALGARESTTVKGGLARGGVGC